MRLARTLRRLAHPALTRAVKRPIGIGLDCLLLLAATWVAYSFRLEALHQPQGVEWLVYGLSVAVALPVFHYYGLYRTIFRYTGLGTLVAIAKAIFIYGVLYSLIMLAWQPAGVPRALATLQPLLALLFIGGWRALVRLWFGRMGLRRGHIERQKVMIYGAGAAGRRLLSALQNSPEMKVVGLVDDDRHLQGNSINGVPIYGLADIAEVIERKGVTDVLLAIPSLSQGRRNAILDALRKVSVHVRTLPGVLELAQGKVQASDVRELDVEDLLGRDPVLPDMQLMTRHNQGRVVLVTGAGGSIGSELCRQIALVRPARLLLVEQSEYALYSVHRELADKVAQAVLPPCEIVPLLCSVRDEARLDEIMQVFRPHIVYHAAAYKHVPLVEHNIIEGVCNNTLGTLCLARCALRAAVAEFVFVSTDKAVRPTNVMGASKRLAEMVLQAMAAQADLGTMVPGATGLRRTRFSIVRFGNVLGSSGSVVPLFRQQIRNGGPVTVTHPEVTRFFMTIPEAAQLVVQAGAMAHGGEVFVLDMGQPVRIVDLASRMIELSGLAPRNDENLGGDIEIVFTGMRPGEKLYEELLIGNDPQRTDHPRIMMAREAFLPWHELAPRLKELEALAARADHAGIRNLLGRLVSGFRPERELVDWTYLESTGQLLSDTSPSSLERNSEPMPLRRVI